MNFENLTSSNFGRFGKKSKPKGGLAIPLTPSSIASGGSVAGLVSTVAGGAGGNVAIAGAAGAAGGLSGVAGTLASGMGSSVFGMAGLLGSKAAMLGILLGAATISAGVGVVYNLSSGSRSSAQYRDGVFQDKAYQNIMSDAAQDRAAKALSSSKQEPVSSSLDFLKQEAKREGMAEEPKTVSDANSGDVPSPNVTTAQTDANAPAGGDMNTGTVPSMKKSPNFNSDMSSSPGGSGAHLSTGGGMFGGIGKGFQPLATSELGRAGLAGSGVAGNAGRGAGSAKRGGAQQAGSYGQSKTTGDFSSQSARSVLTRDAQGRSGALLAQSPRTPSQNLSEILMGQSSRSSALAQSKMAGDLSAKSAGPSGANTAFTQATSLGKTLSGLAKADLASAKAGSANAFDNGSAGTKSGTLSGVGLGSGASNVPPSINGQGDNSNVTYPSTDTSVPDSGSGKDSTPWKSMASMALMAIMAAVAMIMMAKQLSASPCTKCQAKQCANCAKAQGAQVASMGQDASSSFGQSNSNQVGSNFQAAGAAIQAAASTAAG